VRGHDITRPLDDPARYRLEGLVAWFGLSDLRI
jgi:hypothetical protein